MSSSLKTIQAKRDTYLKRVRDTLTIGREAKENPDKIGLFVLRCARIETESTGFDEAHFKIISSLSEGENPALHDAIRAEYDKTYFEVMALLERLSPKPSSVVASHLVDEPARERPSHVKLPKVVLPQFKGDYKAWPTFIDLFNSIVHFNKSLTNIERFQYLMSCLSGEPLTLLKSFSISGNNYKAAYDALVVRYQSKRKLAFTYWEEIRNVTLKSQSPAELRRLLDTFNENIAMLRNLGFNTDQWDFLLFHTLLTKLNQKIRERFEMHHVSDDIPTYKMLVTFVENQCRALELSKGDLSGVSEDRGRTRQSHTASLLAKTAEVSSCPSCQGQAHPLGSCSPFLAKSPQERHRVARECRACLNCLRYNHTIKDCTSLSNCSKCGVRHHTLLHFGERALESTTPSDNAECHTPSATSSTPSEPSITAGISALTNTSGGSFVLLATLQLEIMDVTGQYQTVRALMDPGSQANFMTHKCLQRLGLLGTPTSVPVRPLGGGYSTMSTTVSCSIRPKQSQSGAKVIEAYVLPKICGFMPSTRIDTHGMEHLCDMNLADSQFHKPGPIDMLLGAEEFIISLLPERKEGLPGQPVALNTKFGWILMGRVEGVSAVAVNSFHVAIDDRLEETVKKFWEIEDTPKSSHSYADNDPCEMNFVGTHCRDKSGRFIVSLPFSEPEPTFIGTRSVALRRFLSLEKRLLCDPPLYQEYCDFMRDYLYNHHMEQLNIPFNNSAHCYFIPHHCVVKTDMNTTKLRVVFDASAKDVEGRSLNDTLLVGPKLQNDIVSIVFRFRFHAVAFTADVKQMYRQILIAQPHRDYQRILWRFSPEDPIQEYRLNTVTYGVSSSPFLALRTMKQLASDHKDMYPKGARIIETDVYVDDLVTGSDSLDAAFELQSQVVGILGTGCLELRKWTSSHPVLLEKIDPSHRHPNALSFDDETGPLKVLGLIWNPNSDCFSFNVNSIAQNCTKRAILSDLARIFDVLGFLVPVTIKLKVLIQQLWSTKLKWDDPAPSNIAQIWSQYKQEVPLLADIRIPRRITQDSRCSYEIHAFCDASELGYATVIYLRSVTLDTGSIDIQFLCALSKVAPLKKITLPRLELCAAVLLADLLKFVKSSTPEKIIIDRIWTWSDSSITLAWLASPPARWKTFVSNRVSHIQSIVEPSSWHHIRSEHNPSDCGTRGLTPAELMNHTLWWAGPPWLRTPEAEWPSSPLENVPSSDHIHIEERKAVVSMIIAHEYGIDGLLDRFSSLAKVQRIVAYVYRFINNTRNRQPRRHGAITQQELSDGLLVLVKRTQRVMFDKDIHNLETGRPVVKELRKLSPFFDNKGVLRVGGRLANSRLSFDSKHPALLPRDHRLTELIIEYTHLHNMHPGPQQVQYLISQNFWILSARRAIRHILSRCNQCFRVDPKPLQPRMADLPPSRVQQLKSFQCAGVDYCGPFTTAITKGRGTRTTKSYICLFICFTTKAVHIELTTDLTTEAFVASLKRFVARRGQCSKIVCDNGTNFVGASRQLKAIMQAGCEQENIEFSFIPPSAPHMGGLWERSNRSVKTHLYRVIGKQILTFEELYTLLTQIEAVLNSRPLYPMSSDPNDLDVLTPGHFLTLAPLTSVPEEDVTDVPQHRLTRWRLLSKMHFDFWARWHNEYLHTLNQRQKWYQDNSGPTVGNLVLIKDELTPPLQWRLGRITELHPGRDGICRVATVKTKLGVLQRPLVKLCLLPSQ